ncbi:MULTISPECIES: HEPN domain-containing protein [Parabacteroides]|uniref:HEPN domain-containing protein n=1 Tax=Parabacteroides leei TaxID=2939491 RepID=UPI001896DFCF|nr:HEPN domain-containing protein [Parabacteroides goldsteinii]
MNDELRKEIILYRMESAEALLKEIDSHINNGFYNTAVNRMYYACFYSVSALLLHHLVDGVKTHEGIRQMFGKHFITTGLLPKDFGKFYTILFARRSAADYEDFLNYDEQSARELQPQTKVFIKAIHDLINK